MYCGSHRYTDQDCCRNITVVVLLPIVLIIAAVLGAFVLGIGGSAGVGAPAAVAAL